jgi:hypothetical protein
VKNSGSFSSHLDTVGCGPDQQSLRYSSIASNSQPQYPNDFRNESSSATNRNSSSHHGSQSSNLSGDGQTDLLLRRQQSSSRDNTGAASRGNTMCDQRVRSRSRSR